MASVLLKFGGTLLAGAEEFQHSLVIDDALLSADEEAWSQYAATALAAAFTAATAANPFPGNTVYTWVSAAEILNLSTGTLRAAHTRAVSHAGGGSGGLPPQCSVAISLRGGTRPNGQPLRGRFYAPGPRIESQFYSATEGRLTAGGCESYWVWADALLDALILETEEVAPQVWSRSLATTQTVDEVRVGRAVDTIRSRRGDLPETYYAGP